MSLKRISLVFLVLILCAIGRATIYYVKPEGNDSNTGTSWQAAFATLTKAAEVTKNPGQVWVASGIYTEPAEILIQTYASFYGGFAGTETSLSQRDPEANPTVINGDKKHRCAKIHGTLDGFHITGGYSVDFGGGIYNEGGTVMNCRVYGNEAGWNGGGIYSRYYYPNSQTLYQATVSHCRIYNNLARNSGGIESDGSVDNCAIYGNKAVESVGGISNSGLTKYCTIYSNEAELSGGGIAAGRYPVLNCISWKNKCGDIQYQYNSVSIENCCFGGAQSENGNFSADPLFVNTTGDMSAWDFHLQNGSPCIDSGRPGVSPEDDLEGNPRPGSDGKVCIGAYESPDEYIPQDPAPPRRLYVKTDGNDLLDGTSWENAFKTITRAASLSLENDSRLDIWVAWGSFQEGQTITLQASDSLYGGFSGTESELSERDVDTTPTIIVGNGAGECVLNYGIMDSLDVAGGGYTAGIKNESGTMRNCRIFNNYCGILNRFGLVDDCRIYGNTHGGIYNEYGTVSHSSIYHNASQSTENVSWGGIYNMSGTVRDCMVYGNENCGIYNKYDAIVQYCNVYQNGKGIYNYVYGIVTQCRIYENLIEGGIINYNGTVTNCLVYGNKTLYDGGGIRNYYGKILNCTVYGNSANWGSGGICNYDSYNTVVVSNCISWKNEGGDILGYPLNNHCCFGEAKNENGNLCANPLFVNTSGDMSMWDFHLKDGSPCIDAGLVEGAPENDFEGNVRPGGDGKVCMGAYESPDGYLPGEPAPAKRLYVKPDGNDDHDGTGWDKAVKTITRAIYLSMHEDSIYKIWVGEGTYQEGRSVNIPITVSLYGGFSGMESQLSERDPEAHPTIINGSDTHRCVDNFGIIDGFHVTKGYDEKWGGGIYNNLGTVTCCKVYDNKAGDEGAGIYNINGGIISYCDITDNILNGSIYQNQQGGGISNRGGQVSYCTIARNKGGWAGGIYNAYFFNQASINYCTIYENQSMTNAGGVQNNDGTVANSIVHDNYARANAGGIMNQSGEVVNCRVYHNKADGKGGGIWNNSGTVTNSLIYMNQAGEQGGGIFIWGSLINCMVFGNSLIGDSYNGGGIYIDIENDKSTVTNCISWKNKGGDIIGKSVTYCCYAESTGENGNIFGIPLFTDLSGDMGSWNFHLQNGSPCIDAGASLNAPALDMDGSPRPGGDGKICMGAYESPDAYLPGHPTDSRRLYVKPEGNDEADGTSWTTALKTITEGLSRSYEGDVYFEILVAEGTYREGKNILIPPATSLFGGFAGFETSLEQRDIAANPSVIDGNNSAHCIVYYGALDGFSVTKGYGSDKGGGIFVEHGRVVRCNVYGNQTPQKGGGIYNNQGTVTGCLVYENKSLKSGGGIHNDKGRLTDCTVSGNQADGSGGGIYNNSSIHNCRISGNISYSAGGGIFNNTADSAASNCIIYDNQASEGGGIHNVGNVLNCAVYANRSNNYPGGGIDNTSGMVTNCTFYKNEAQQDGGIHNESGQIINCISWKNRNGDIRGGNVKYSCFVEAQDTDGNFATAPNFVNSSGDFSGWDLHLKNGSPCIDAGILEGAPAFDLEGNPRPGSDGAACLGAYESPDEYAAGVPAPSLVLFVKPDGNDDQDGLGWNTAVKTINKAMSLSFEGDFLYELWIAE